jgi:predicted RecA/RadA family phage recombinase
MRNIYALPLAKVARLTKGLALIALLMFTANYTQAQCTGCTQTVSTNTAVTVNAGAVVCITYAGTYNSSITFNGGTLCIGPSTTVSSGVTVPSGATLSVYGTITGNYNQNGGTVTIYSGGTIELRKFQPE